jgi:hypothetical protein
LLFEFHVPATHTFYRVELRDHGPHGVEAQSLDPVEIRIARTFRQDMNLTRTPREMAIAWADEERKAIQVAMRRPGASVAFQLAGRR